MMQHILMNIRRINFFSFGDRCNTTHLFYSFARLYRLSSRNHFHHRAQRALRPQHLLKQCPTPSANRGRHVRSAGHYISNAPPRPQTEAAARAQRRLYYRSSPRRVPLRGMRSETKGSAPQRAEARRRAVGERQAPPAAGVPLTAGVPVEGAAGTGVPVGEPVEGGAGTGVPGGVTAKPAAEVPLPAAGVPVGVDVVGEGAAGTGVPAGVPVEGGAGTGVPGGVTAEPAAEEPVEGAGAPGVAPPVGEPPCCALAPCFFLSRCTKLTA